MRLHRLAAVATTALAAAACGGSSNTPPTCFQTGCSTAGQVCENVAGGAPACFDPVYVAGRVYDLATTNGIVGARVVGQDVNGAPVSSVALSTTGGAYQFKVGMAVTRNADGSPASGTVALRVDAKGYATFPSGLRVALPIALTSATHGTGRWTVQTSLTDVGLQAIAGAPAGEIDGTVQLPASGGVLVVAECGGVAYTAVPGSDGTYKIFNVPDGTCSVTAYAKGVNYTPVAVTMTAGVPSPATADLVKSAVPTATVSGNVNFVSKTDWPTTSVLLVVASTYDAARARGISPPGLKASNVSNGSNWTITGIPNGHYRVLAAFETDYIVRDTSKTGGTEVLEFQVLNGVPYLMDGTTSAASLGSFKVTGAVRLEAPIADTTGACSTLSTLPADPGTLPVGGCTTTSTSPTFAWEAYPSTTYYEVTVVDETGVTVWDAQASASPVAYGATTGNVTSTTTPAQTLTVGSTYQVRLNAYQTQGTITSWLSASEDLLGVFTVVP
jgi:hypothetical protein